jgi:hypothetical protein
MNTDYVTNRWTHNFGRYVMVTLAYRFNSMSGGAGGSPGGGGFRGGPGGGGGGWQGGPPRRF